MSDKHTDAQGNVFRKKPVEVEAIQWDGNKFDATPPQWFCDAMYAFGNPGFLMRFDNNIVIETLEGQMTASPGDWIIRGVKGEIYPCKPDIFELTYERATEGQAQTSAAGWLTGLPVVPVGDYCEFIIACKRANGKTHVFSAYYLNGKGLLSRWGDEPEDGTPVTGWFFENEVDGDNVFELVCHEGDEITHWQAMPDAPDAAQLADSTAPGAPVDQERADFEHWYVTHIDGAEIGSTDCAARWSTWLARSGGFYKAPSDWKIAPMPWNAPAAPTAQQSLTAGGAVPELSDAYLLDAFHRHGFFPENLTGQAKFYSAIREIVGKIAAAPLPQVQSEALDEAPIECWSADQEDFNATELDSVLTMHEELKPGDTVWVGEAVRPEPSQLIDADDILTTMGERAHDIAGEHAEDYPNVSKEAEQELNTLLAAWIGKHASPSFWTVANIRPYVLSHDDFPSDPTPVHCEFAVDQQPVTPSGALADNDGGVA